jgi:nitrogen fixation/metabolism regulation signal transduction histidine kinase
MNVIRRTFKILAPGNSLQRRTAYSLAVVRMILAPVIFMAIYYLFRMGWLVDRIVNVDAPAAALAQQASIEMLEARRAERNYLVLRDASYLAANHEAVAKTQQTLSDIAITESNDNDSLQTAVDALALYGRQLQQAVAILDRPEQSTTNRVQTLVKDYERDLDELLRRSRRVSRRRLMDEVRERVDSFDSQISKTIEETDPELQRLTEDLQTSSEAVLQQTAHLESVNWARVQADHANARRLLRQAEWALSIVSALTILVSIWVSYVLPRQVVKPLLSLKEAVDHAAQGNYEIDFDVSGKGEVVDLVESLRRMLASLHPKRWRV